MILMKHFIAHQQWNSAAQLGNLRLLIILILHLKCFSLAGAQNLTVSVGDILKCIHQTLSR